MCVYACWPERGKGSAFSLSRNVMRLVIMLLAAVAAGGGGGV